MRKTVNDPIVRKVIELIGQEHGALKQFAAKADISLNALTTCISRDKTPNLPMLINISRAYSVSLDELCADYPTERRFVG
jgi:hypothetical protein